MKEAFHRSLWAGIGLFVAGGILDLRWHATHEEFETPGDQLQAHWLLWLGVLVLLAVAGAALARSSGPLRSRGYAGVLAAGIFYALVSVWHFWEHARGRDPDLPHVLLYVGIAGILGSAVATTLIYLRPRRRPAR